ncbi:hypothetical protein L1887_06749 [Cichorium endivia]|nr:hypothetical protein L1887_06749 [Cichorium endivia]
MTQPSSLPVSCICTSPSSASTTIFIGDNYSSTHAISDDHFLLRHPCSEEGNPTMDPPPPPLQAGLRAGGVEDR